MADASAAGSAKDAIDWEDGDFLASWLPGVGARRLRQSCACLSLDGHSAGHLALFLVATCVTDSAADTCVAGEGGCSTSAAPARNPGARV